MHWSTQFESLLLIVLAVQSSTEDADCPKGWKKQQTDDSCIIAIRANMTWIAAKEHCRRLQPYARLASKRSSLKEEFQESAHWMGSSDLMSEGDWVYEDGDRKVGDMVWADGQPTDKDTPSPFNVKDCAKNSRAGVFDEPCHSQEVLLPFACSLEMRYMEPPFSHPPKAAACPVGWTRGKQACYKVVPGDKQDSMDAAECECHKLDARAVVLSTENTIDSMETPDVSTITESNKNLFWLDEKKGDDNCSLAYFFKEEPQYIRNKNCSTGETAHTLCQRKLCSQRCDHNSTLFGDHCYKVVNKPMTRPDAQKHCRSLYPNGNLTSVHSSDENHFLTSLAMPAGVPFPYKRDTLKSWHHFWIGLHHKTGWQWEDGSEARSFQWSQSPKASDRWATLEVLHVKWQAHKKCLDKKYPFICKFNTCG